MLWFLVGRRQETTTFGGVEILSPSIKSVNLPIRCSFVSQCNLMQQNEQ